MGSTWQGSAAVGVALADWPCSVVGGWGVEVGGFPAYLPLDAEVGRRGIDP